MACPYRFILVFLLLSGALCVSAQNRGEAEPENDTLRGTSYFSFDETEHYIDFGMGWGYWYGRDKGMLSPLIHKGNFGHFRFGWERQDQLTLQHFKFEPIFGITSPDQNDTKFLTPALNVQYDFQYFLSDFPKIKTSWYAGAAFDMLGVARFSSAYVNHVDYEFMNSFSFATTMNRSFDWLKDHPLEMSLELSIPLFSNVARPLYSQSAPGEFVTQSEINEFVSNLNPSYVSFESLVRVKSNVAVTYYLANGNGLRLGYTWDYYRYNKIPDNTVNAALHRVYLVLLFNL